MKTALLYSIVIIILASSQVSAELPLATAIDEAKTKIEANNPLSVHFLPAVTEESFILGVEHAINDYDDFLLLQAEELGQKPQKIDPAWFDSYRQIYANIVSSKKIPRGVVIKEMKHLIKIAISSPNKIYCDSEGKYLGCLDLRLDIEKVSDSRLGYSLPVLYYGLGKFSRN